MASSLRLSCLQVVVRSDDGRKERGAGKERIESQSRVLEATHSTATQGGRFRGVAVVSKGGVVERRGFLPASGGLR
eukprot:scaffold27350_cov38-Tisochrysis_lutea.AAC.4